MFMGIFCVKKFKNFALPQDFSKVSPFMGSFKNIKDIYYIKKSKKLNSSSVW